jgi:hypothetical protein
MMPAGKYYVGDLCYVMHPQWEEFCYLTIRGDDIVDGEITLGNGVKVASFCTYFGDGFYEDQHGGGYPVDAGLIGCIRVEDIDDRKVVIPEGDAIEFGQIIEFDEEFECSCDEGVIYIGHIRIDTKGPDEDDEFDVDEEEDDENT